MPTKYPGLVVTLKPVSPNITREDGLEELKRVVGFRGTVYDNISQEDTISKYSYLVEVADDNDWKLPLKQKVTTLAIWIKAKVKTSFEIVSVVEV